MKILVLGGTVFLGRHVVEAAFQRGHDITVFHRGVHPPESPFPPVELIRGDRDGGVHALDDREWDAVIDTSGFVPRIVRQSAAALRGRVQHYTFVSSISVYREFVPGMDESAPVLELDPPDSESVAEHYGALKAACERVVEEYFPGQSLNVRPGLIVGPYDKTDRFTYWPARVANGGQVLAPGHPNRPVQFIDSRDLAEWMVRMTEQGVTGTVQATGPDTSLTMAELLTACRQATGSEARFVWMDDAFLKQHEVGQWLELPLWIDETGPTAMLDVDITQALQMGLKFRPLETTILDTLAWDANRDPALSRLAGLAPAREQELLQAWTRRGGL